MLRQRGKAYGHDLLDRVFVASEGGAPVGAIARMLLVSTSYLSKAPGRRRQSGCSPVSGQSGKDDSGKGAKFASGGKGHMFGKGHASPAESGQSAKTSQ